MKIVLSLALSSALISGVLCVSDLSAEGLFVMGSKSGFSELEKEQKDRDSIGSVEKDHGKDNHSPGEGDDKPKKSPPRKKPRLKYRDLYECGC